MVKKVKSLLYSASVVYEGNLLDIAYDDIRKEVAASKIQNAIEISNALSNNCNNIISEPGKYSRKMLVSCVLRLTGTKDGILHPLVGYKFIDVYGVLHGSADKYARLVRSLYIKFIDNLLKADLVDYINNNHELLRINV
jgi:hypothetical protein